MNAISGSVERAEADVVARAAAGDEIAFTRLVEAHDSEMYRICVAVARDQTIAADGVQAAWAIAWRKLGTVRDPARVRPWLVSIAVNETKTLLRRRSRIAAVETVPEEIPLGGGIDPATGIASLDLRAALARLDPDDRALLAMRYVAGFNATELAAALGGRPAAIRQRLKRLVDKVRTELE